MSWAHVEAALGVRVTGSRPVSGGSINDAWRLDTDRGPLFLKAHRDPPPGFFAAEADGLARLRAAGVRVPEVVGAADGWLALEWLDPGAPRFEDAGRALALLRSHHGARFGLERDNYMGAVPQKNAAPAAFGGRSPSCPSFSGELSPNSFAEFFRSCRIDPLAGDLPASVRRRVDRLDLSLLGEPTPTLVHGDLWSGNLLHTTIGPVFIDPAVHYGHPEQDLAMTRLFGGFPAAFEAAYREAAGLPRHADPEFPRRVAALNLYPLLVHVRLFGGGYVRSIEAALDTIEARP